MVEVKKSKLLLSSQRILFHGTKLQIIPSDWSHLKEGLRKNLKNMRTINPRQDVFALAPKIPAAKDIHVSAARLFG